jgi:hypothetical protein
MLKKSRIIILSILGLGLLAMPAAGTPITTTFTAGDIKNVMADDYGDPLSDETYLWGIWAIRAMPLVSSGGYDILSGWVNDRAQGDFWSYAEPSPKVDWADPYGTEVGYFHLSPASEHLNTDAHPLYFIADQPATAFQSYAFDNTSDNGYGRSTYLGVCENDSALGCNSTDILPNDALFGFSFELDPGASLLGWQFLVDGSKYYRTGAEPDNWSSSSLWIEDFIGGDAWLPQEPYRQSEAGSGLTHNAGSGYQVLYPVPEPSTIVLAGLGLAALIAVRKRAWSGRR